MEYRIDHITILNPDHPFRKPVNPPHATPIVGKVSLGTILANIGVSVNSELELFKCLFMTDGLRSKGNDGEQSSPIFIDKGFILESLSEDERTDF